MPRIAQVEPQFRGLDTGELSSAARRIGIAGRESADSIRSGFNQLGSGIEQLGEHIGQTQKADYLSAFTQHQLDEDTAFEKAKQDYGTDPQFTQRYLEERKDRLDKFNEDFDGSMWGTGAQEYQRQVNDQAMLTSGKEAVAFQTSVERDKGVAAAETASRAIALSWANDPLNGNHYLEQLETQVKPLLPAEHATTETEKLKTGAANLAGESLVTTLESKPNITAQDVDTVLGAMQDKDGALAQHMSIEKMSELEGRLGKLKNNINSISSALAAQQLPDIYKQMRQNGGTDPASRGLSIIGQMPERTKEDVLAKNKAKQDYESAVSYGKTTDAVWLAPQSQLAPATESVNAAIKGETDPDKARVLLASQSALHDAIGQRQKEFAKNPAGYVIDHSPKVQNAYKAYQAQPTPENFANYADAQAGVQHTMNPSEPVHLLTPEIKQQAQEIVRSITTTPEGAAGASQNLYAMSQSFGRYWSPIAHDLMQEGVFTREQYVAARLYADPHSQGTGEAILTASAMKGGDRFNLNAVPEEKARKLAITALAPLSSSLGNVNDRPTVMGGFTDALTHLIQVNGKTDDVSVAQLAHKMVLNESQFVGSAHTIRAPASLDGDKITAGSEDALDNIDTRHDLVIPPNRTGTLNPENQRTNYINTLKLSARWYTNEDGSGVKLYDQDMHNVMERKNGKAVPIEMKWDDLNKAAAKNPSVTSKLISILPVL